MKWLAVLVALLAAPAAAQDVVAAPDLAAPDLAGPPAVAGPDVAESPGGVLRWLDKVSGETADIELSRGQSAVSGRLTIQLDDCRYPVDDPAANAFAHLTITENQTPTPIFSGWMIAASPALSALDHPRYDVWVLRCITPAGTPDAGVTTPAEGSGG